MQRELSLKLSPLKLRLRNRGTLSKKPPINRWIISNRCAKDDLMSFQRLTMVNPLLIRFNFSIVVILKCKNCNLVRVWVRSTSTTAAKFKNTRKKTSIFAISFFQLSKSISTVVKLKLSKFCICCNLLIFIRLSPFPSHLPHCHSPVASWKKKSKFEMKPKIHFLSASE